uniref:Uncharacterized protein n=1 Tax=Anopheles funestus TaxID=62324 RepID=A0A182S444_ANOFN
GYSYNPFTHFFVVLDSRRFFYRQSRLLPLCGCSSFCLLRLPSPLVSACTAGLCRRCCGLLLIT